MGISSLFLDKEQTKRLLGYIQEYRRYTLTQLPPSVERNIHQRLLQALQGRLIQESEQEHHTTLSLELTNEEKMILKAMVTDLRLLKIQEPASHDRDAIIVDLTNLKGALEKLSVPEQPKRFTRSFL